MPALLLTVLASWGVYALIGLGVVMIYRTSRILNIAIGEFAVFVGYVVATALEHNLPLAVALAVGAAAAIVLGAVVFFFFARRVMGQPPHVGLMLTIGIGVILNGCMIVFFGGGMKGVSTGLPGFVTFDAIRFPTADLVAVIGSWAIIACILLIYGLTNIGLQMRAVAQNVTLSAQLGVNVNQTVLMSWIIGLLAIGFAGIIHGERAFVALSASSIGISALIACLIGGMDSIRGTIIAALIVSASENLTALYIDPRYVLLVPVLILMFVLTIRPWGLFGTIEEFKRV